jgi:GT2 family glycosyltransferase
VHISVLVPTYRRPGDLTRCLQSIAAQSRPPDAVIVVCRENDFETRDALSGGEIGIPISLVHVRATGVVAALNAGLARISGDVVAITDDDAAPRADWLKRIEEHFMRLPEIGGVGGRDYVHGDSWHADSVSVGILEWFGRQVGNHHLGIGSPRYVDMLKGVNMSFRIAAIGEVRFDERLRGSGAQVHNELAFCLALGRKGWRFLYDPEVAVDHYPAQRFDEDQRSQKSLLAASNSAFNETLTLLDHLPILVQPVFLLWAILIGARDLPGIAQCVRLALKGEAAWVRLPAVLRGRLAAVQVHYKWRLPRHVRAIE